MTPTTMNSAKMNNCNDIYIRNNTGRPVRVELDCEVIPQEDSVEYTGFLFYRKTKIIRPKFNTVAVTARLKFTEKRGTEIDRLFIDRLESFRFRIPGHKSDYVFDFEDCDGTVYRNCMVVSAEFTGTVGTEYTIQYDHFYNPDGVTNDCRYTGIYNVPLTVDDPLEYIRSHAGLQKTVR